MIGKFEIGTINNITEDHIIYPQDLVGVKREDISNPKVLQIALFLQSLDKDKEQFDTIIIPTSLKIDSKSNLMDMSYDESNKLLKNLNIQPITLEEAKQHLKENLLLTQIHIQTPKPTPTPTPTLTPTPMPTPTLTPTLTTTATPTPTPILNNITLPPIPSETISNYLTPTNSLRIYDTLKIKELLNDSPTINNSSCNLSEVLDSDRVKIGGSILNSDGDSECKVRVKEDGTFEFLTKTTNSIHKKVQGSPAWAEFRFLVPTGYIADKFSYEISWYRLFGSYPSSCADREKNASGECQYNTDENWRDDIEAGIFIL
jgi:hypothetical protein